MDKDQILNNTTTDGEIFTLVDDKGNEELYKELLRFQNPELGNWYICLEPVEQLEDEEAEVVAFSFVENDDADEDAEIELMPIEDDKEWEMVQEVLNTFIDDEGNLNL